MTSPDGSCLLADIIDSELCAEDVIRLLQNSRIDEVQRALARLVAFAGERLMKFRTSSIVTVFVTTIVTATASFVTPAAAEILTVCANTTQNSAAPERFPSRRLADAIIPLGSRAEAEDVSLVALWRDADGFDLLMNWGESDEHSLRADGAQIIGTAPNSELVHLMVAHDDGGVEHFLFKLDQSGAGELLRSLAGDAPGADAPNSLNAVCVKPH